MSRYRIGADRAELLYVFEAGEIRHVHGVYRDPYADALWCLTGDRPEECRILRTEDQFYTFDIVGRGDETWRAVSLLFTPEAIYYGSDAEFSLNHIYRIDRQTGIRETVAEVDGPVYYSHAIGQDLFFAPTAELCPGQGSPVASLWHVVSPGTATRIFSFTKSAEISDGPIRSVKVERSSRWLQYRIRNGCGSLNMCFTWTQELCRPQRVDIWIKLSPLLPSTRSTCDRVARTSDRRPAVWWSRTAQDSSAPLPRGARCSLASVADRRDAPDR